IGYGLAPRLNAAGRLGSARAAVELLTTVSAQQAAELASFLEVQNQERQKLERQILSEARPLAGEAVQGGAPALLLARPHWPSGLIGIVASRLVDLFARPVLLIALRDGRVGVGSGRSVPGFRLHEALAACSGTLLGHGGHATAAGFRVEAGRIVELREQFASVPAHPF